MIVGVLLTAAARQFNAGVRTVDSTTHLALKECHSLTIEATVLQLLKL